MKIYRSSKTGRFIIKPSGARARKRSAYRIEYYRYSARSRHKYIRVTRPKAAERPSRVLPPVEQVRPVEPVEAVAPIEPVERVVPPREVIEPPGAPRRRMIEYEYEFEPEEVERFEIAKELAMQEVASARGKRMISRLEYTPAMWRELREVIEYLQEVGGYDV